MGLRYFTPEGDTFSRYMSDIIFLDLLNVRRSEYILLLTSFSILH